jgi:hypothetical protein
MAIHTFSFEVVGIPASTPPPGPVPAPAPAPTSAPVINLFRSLSPSGGYNLDGVTQSIGEPPGPPIPDYEVVLTLGPLQREPGQASTLHVEVRLNDLRATGQFTIVLTSTDQQVAPLPSSILTDSQGVAVMEVLAVGVGSTTISATVTINSVVYTSNQATLIVITQQTRENYDATGYGVIRASLESTLSRGLFPNPQRLSHEEQDRKYPGDTGLRRAAYFANAELVFMPAFLQQK